MFDAVDCMTRSHDPLLVAAALMVCAFASAVTFGLFRKVQEQTDGASPALWLGLTGLTASSGIWATHFIAMTAFHPTAAIGFDCTETALSFVVAIVLSTTAFWIAAARSTPVWRVVAGIVLGLATSLMHYVGVSGIRVAGRIVMDPAYVAASIALAVVLSVAATLAAGSCRLRSQRLIASVLFVLSIGTLHFTGMVALSIVPDPSVVLQADLLSGQMLGYGIAGVTMLIVTCTLASWLIDQRGRCDNEIRLRFLARHDVLTSLPNRLLFQELVQNELTSGALQNQDVALFCLDLDGFKGVNDLFGHAAGDALLIHVARRLQSLLGERCVAARLGGDEFALMATALGPHRMPAALSQSILDRLAEPYIVEGNRVDVGCSIGVALFPLDGKSYQVLMNKADIALGRAKSDGRGVVRFFEAAMDERMQERHRLARDLRKAIGTGQLRVEYQPQIDILTNRLLGFEALMRWDHPDDGPITPSTFIPIAEETGLILPLGAWMLREACGEAARWPGSLSVAVNISMAQFRQTGLDLFIQSVLEETGLIPNRLELEVTESLFFDQLARTLATLNRIKALGVRIAMDDFGTGYSSLSTLQSFAFDKIKIDRSFTGQIGLSSKGTAIVRAVLGLGESLDMKVVAEGVETRDQLAFLREHRCAAYQGHLYGLARPIARYRDLLAVEASSSTDANVVVLCSA